MKYQAIYIVKPEAFSKREEIIYFIEKNSQLRVVKTMDTKLTTKDISMIFMDDLNTQLIDAIEKHLINKNIQIALVESKEEISSQEMLVDELTRVCGSHFDPSKCAVDTIRYNFGINKCKNYSGVTYFMNAVHKTSQSESKLATKWCKEHIFNTD